MSALRMDIVVREAEERRISSSPRRRPEMGQNTAGTGCRGKNPAPDDAPLAGWAGDYKERTFLISKIKRNVK